VLTRRRLRDEAAAAEHVELLQQLTADIRRDRAAQARQQQDEAWASYWPNIVQPEFVGSAVAR
jgi:hypothetical protein